MYNRTPYCVVVAMTTIAITIAMAMPTNNSAVILVGPFQDV